MHPGTDETTGAQAEGGDYARALLDRIGAGVTKPEDLATLMQFLHSGALLHGFAVVLHEALRLALQRPIERPR